MISTPSFLAYSIRLRIQPVPSSSASTAHHSWNAVAKTRSCSAISSIAPSSARPNARALAVAVGVEPDPVEPELEWDLEQVREALLRVGERLHPRGRVAVLLVAAPGGDVAVARLVDDLEQVGPPAEPAVVAERRAQADALAAEVLADQLRGERELFAERNGWRLREHRLGLGSDRRGTARLGRRRGCRCAAGCRRAPSPRAARAHRARARACARRRRTCTAPRAPRAGGRAAPRHAALSRGRAPPVLRHVRAEEAREPLADRGRLRVVADEQYRHVVLSIPPTLARERP